METKEVQLKDRMVFDFFHITALKHLAKIEHDKLTIIQGRVPKVYAVYGNEKNIPDLREFKVSYNGNEISLHEFSTLFRDVKIELQNLARENNEGKENVQPEKNY